MPYLEYINLHYENTPSRRSALYFLISCKPFYLFIIITESIVTFKISYANRFKNLKITTTSLLSNFNMPKLEQEKAKKHENEY